MARLFSLPALVLFLAPSGLALNNLAGRVATLTKGFEGTVVLYARNLDTGQEFAMDADARVRTASTIKLPILCALESLVAAGKVEWDERLVVRAEDKVSGSGVLRSLADGTEVGIRNLAILMIVVSDNTATNLILDRIGADAVNAYLDSIGLSQTRVNRKVAGGKTAPGWSKAGLVEENKRFGLGVSTPRDMVKLLDLLHQGKIVSAQASKDVLQILEQQQIKTSIGRHAPSEWRVASKSGSLDALRSDVGIVYTGADSIAMAVTVDEMPRTDYSPDNAGETLIWQLTETIVDGLSRR
ncbi:MAG: serine hydrolase [Vicinamibacterales bacterium]